MEQKKEIYEAQESVQSTPPEENSCKRSAKSRFSLDNFLYSHNFLHPFRIKIILLVILLVIVALGVLSFDNSTIFSKTTSLDFENIGELATQAALYTNVQTINKDRTLWGIHIPLTTSKSIFSYDGVIKAGYDFSQIELDVSQTDKTITVTLPEVKILSNTLDYDSLLIYDESESIFTPISLEDNNEALTNLEEEGEQKAIENGLFENARANAEVLIKGMLSGMIDLEKYEIVFK